MSILSKDDVIKYHMDGYAGPFDALDADAAAGYRNFFFSNIIEKVEGSSEFLSNVHVISKTVVDVLTGDPIKEALHAILGEDILLWKASFVRKRPNEKADLIKWHQDSYYRQMHPYNALVIWLAFDDVTLENGCVEVIPGSHWHDVPHKQEPGGFFPLVADENYFDAKTPTQKLICKAGQFFIFNERIIHKSEVNLSDKTRLAIVGRFAGTNVFIKSPQTACILVSGEDKYQYNPVIKAPTKL